MWNIIQLFLWPYTFHNYFWINIKTFQKQSPERYGISAAKGLSIKTISKDLAQWNCEIEWDLSVEEVNTMAGENLSDGPQAEIMFTDVGIYY